MAGTATPKATDKDKKDTTTEAQGRFVVSLPKDVGEQIDRVGAKLAKAFESETGIAFELSRAQIVQALVRQALRDTNGDSASDGDGDAPDGDGDDNA